MKKVVLIIALLFAGLAIYLIQQNKFLSSQTEANSALSPQQVAVIVNQSDPLSVQIARYYQKARNIPEENIITVDFPADKHFIKAQKFKQIHQQVETQTPDQVQAYVLTWALPYRVGCMSITTAFATGYDLQYCTIREIGKACGESIVDNPFYDSDSLKPWDDFQLRPTMALAANSFEQAKALIDRGVMADATHPPGTAYLLSTSDKSRNTRAHKYIFTEAIIASDKLNIEILEQDFIEHKDDVLFYFTGLKQVKYLDTLNFLPGAVADHLTSAGGHMQTSTKRDQMSSLRWLEAGATGSYGTVLEPCNYTEKFPSPELLLYYYLKGESLITAYWKSVKWPNEGLFIGEPLAAPYAK